MENNLPPGFQLCAGPEHRGHESFLQLPGGEANGDSEPCQKRRFQIGNANAGERPVRTGIIMHGSKE